MVSVESSGNEFHDLITQLVISYFLLFTLSLLSKFQRLHLVFAFWEIKLIMFSSLSNFWWFHKLLLYPNHHMVQDWRLLFYLLLFYKSQFPSVITSVILLSTFLYYIHFLRGNTDLHTVFTTWGNLGFSQLKLWVLFPILCLILFNTTFWLLLTVELQLSGKHPQSYRNLLSRLQWFFSLPSLSTALCLPPPNCLLTMDITRSSPTVFQSAPNLSILSVFHYVSCVTSTS